MYWVFIFLCTVAVVAQAQLLPRSCRYRSRNTCVRHCYCGWCEEKLRCFEVSRFQEEMPPIVEAQCGGIHNASYTTYMYSKHCKRHRDTNMSTLLILICGVCAFSCIMFGCYVCYLVFQRLPKGHPPEYFTPHQKV